MRRAIKHATFAYGVMLGVAVASSLVTCIRHAHVAFGSVTDIDAVKCRMRAATTRHLRYLEETR